jgi:hypothetical protein
LEGIILRKTKYHQMFNKSINKKACENYLFEDYRLKAGMATWTLALAISGSTKRNFPFEIFRSRLIEEFDAFTYYYAVRVTSEGQQLLVEMCIDKGI